MVSLVAQSTCLSFFQRHRCPDDVRGPVARWTPLLSPARHGARSRHAVTHCSRQPCRRRRLDDRVHRPPAPVRRNGRRDRRCAGLVPRVYRRQPAADHRRRRRLSRARRRHRYHCGAGSQSLQPPVGAAPERVPVSTERGEGDAEARRCRLGDGAGRRSHRGDGRHGSWRKGIRRKCQDECWGRFDDLASIGGKCVPVTAVCLAAYCAMRWRLAEEENAINWQNVSNKWEMELDLQFPACVVYYIQIDSSDIQWHI